jgi:signal transduction histidine kinase
VPSTSDARTRDGLRREANELLASRRRVVEAADDHRRSIERELHDGVIQHLIALGVNLQLARGVADDRSSELSELLETMLQNVHQALDETRELAWRIYPSALLHGDLGDALRATAAGIPVSVDTAALQRCPPEVEACAYFCCVELLNGAADGSRHATVEIRSDSEALLFDVTLTGADLDRWTSRDLSGVGDRLAAFGGRFTIASAPGSERGVRISGVLPTQTDAQASRG